MDLHWQMYESYMSDNITYVWWGTLVFMLYQRQPLSADTHVINQTRHFSTEEMTKETSCQVQ